MRESSLIEYLSSSPFFFFFFFFFLGFPTNSNLIFTSKIWWDWRSENCCNSCELSRLLCDVEETNHSKNWPTPKKRKERKKRIPKKKRESEVAAHSCSLYVCKNFTDIYIPFSCNNHSTLSSVNLHLHWISGASWSSLTCCTKREHIHLTFSNESFFFKLEIFPPTA